MNGKLWMIGSNSVIDLLIIWMRNDAATMTQPNPPSGGIITISSLFSLVLFAFLFGSLCTIFAPILSHTCIFFKLYLSFLLHDYFCNWFIKIIQYSCSAPLSLTNKTKNDLSLASEFYKCGKNKFVIDVASWNRYSHVTNLNWY